MKAVIPICLSLIFWTHQASAHHSFSASFTEDIVQTEGVVSRFVFRNPHVTIYLDVTDDAGDEVRWMVEGGAANLLRQAGFTPHPVRVTQNDDHVIIAYEEYGGRRAIYFDDRDTRDGSDDLIKLGRSRARYEDDSLIIESTHIPAGPTNPQGNWLSDQTTTVETYRRDDDPELGPMLAMEMTVNDPGHLTGPWSMSWRKRYLEGYEFIAVDCQTPLAR